MSNGNREAAAAPAPANAEASNHGSNDAPNNGRDQPAVGFDAVFAPYFAGLREGRLRVQWCPACQRHQWPARSVCTGCLSAELDWTDVEDPTGTVFSWTVVHHAKGTPFEKSAPYAVALVELGREKVRMFAHVPEHFELTIGARIGIDFAKRTADDYPTWRVLTDSDPG